MALTGKTIGQLTYLSELTTDTLFPIELSGITYHVAYSAFTGGIGGTNYIYVMANGTDTENATELSAAYTTAITMSPFTTNRITIVAAPGNYNFGSSAFTMDTQYIDLVSLDGNRSVIFNSANAAGTISITANDVFVKGVDVQTKKFTIADSLNLLKVENCVGGNNSFDAAGMIGYGNASGTFTNCQGGIDSFGGASGIASGTFTNCQGGDGSFGGLSSGAAFGTASGTFTNCLGGDYSFGTGTANGTFTNCVGGSNSFGLLTASGTFTNCLSEFSSFGTTLASGTFKDCTGGNNSFGGGSGGPPPPGSPGEASGIFTNCVGGFDSFGGFGGIASGTFTNCQGGIYSFGSSVGSGTITGKLYYCRLTSGSFQTVSSGGITRLCLDGSNVENNQG